MHALYTYDSVKKCTKPVTLGIYRNILLEEYNLSFHKSKQGQCQCLLCALDSARNWQTRVMSISFSRTKKWRTIKYKRTWLGKKMKRTESSITEHCWAVVTQVFCKKGTEFIMNPSTYTLSDSKGYNYICNQSETVFIWNINLPLFVSFSLDRYCRYVTPYSVSKQNHRPPPTQNIKWSVP